MEIARAQLNLAIDIDSEPISGSATWSDGEPRRFSGWIDLAALIEEVRASAAENSGVPAWGEGARPGLS